MDTTIIAKIGEGCAFGFMLKEENFLETFDILLAELANQVKKEFKDAQSQGNSDTEQDGVRHEPGSGQDISADENPEVSTDTGETSAEAGS